MSQQKTVTPDQMVEAMVANRIGELSLELIKLRTVVSSLNAELQAKNERIAELEAKVVDPSDIAPAHVNGSDAEART